MENLSGKVVCIVDTETNGFPQNGGQILSVAWKVIVDFPWIPCDTQLRYIKGRIVRNTHIHGITEEILEEHGLPIDLVMDEFEETLKRVDIVVMHNAQFDYAIIRNERPHLDFKTMCTMRDHGIKNFVGALSKTGRRKLPSLGEFYAKMFGVEPEVSHSADHDVETLFKSLERYYYGKGCYGCVSPSD